MRIWIESNELASPIQSKNALPFSDVRSKDFKQPKDRIAYANPGVKPPERDLV